MSTISLYTLVQELKSKRRKGTMSSLGKKLRFGEKVIKVGEF